MDSKKDLPARDSDDSDDTKETKEAAYPRLVPSEKVREFSSRAQVLKGNRVNSSLTLVRTDSYSKDSNPDSPKPTQKSSDVKGMADLPQKLQTSSDVDSRDELPQKLRDLQDLIDSRVSTMLQLFGEKIKQETQKSIGVVHTDELSHNLQTSSDVDSIDRKQPDLINSKVSKMLQLFDDRICRIEQVVETLNESKLGNEGLKIPQASSATKEAREKMEPFVDEDRRVDLSGTDLKVDEPNAPTTKDDVGLNPDSFSFLISARPLSIPFVTGLFAFALKNVIFYLVMVNLIDTKSPFNKLGIPVSVSREVLVSQVLASEYRSSPRTTS